MIKFYWKLFAIPGATKFSIAALMGRLPAGMMGLAIILPISLFTGCYATAGIVAAATMVGMAFGSPFSGHLGDRYGQCRLLSIYAVCNLLGTLALILSMMSDAPLLIMCAAGVISGASRISTGTMARTRWVHVIQAFDLIQQEKMLQSAYAFESIVDELVFISAPLLVTLLCTLVHPLVGLAACLVLYVCGAISLALQRSTEPTINSTHEKHASALIIPGLWVIFITTLFIGISAGALEVSVVAHAANLSSRTLTGFFMAVLSFASMIAGFWYGACTFNLSPPSLWIRCRGLVVLALVPFALAINLVSLVLALFFAGLLIAPTSIAGQILIKQVLPAESLNEGLSLVVTAMISGMAIGSWVCGILIDKFGVHDASAFPAVAVLAAFLITITYRSILGAKIRKSPDT
ncbi:MAG: hypothetical protein K0R12_748 [Gammaproteobacteria bacterium]|nr:hypothetical protein [Gammaproteobacteria bacterium]